MIKIPTLFERDESKPGHPVIDRIKSECEWVLEGKGIATRKLDGMNVKVESGKLFKRQKPKEGDYDMASYVPCDPSNPGDKYLFEAFNGSSEKLDDGIYEAVGPKIQGNPEHFDTHKLIPVVPPSRSLILDLPVPHHFDGLKDYLSKADIEGIVFHHPDGRMAKIKKKDFGLKR